MHIIKIFTFILILSISISSQVKAEKTNSHKASSTEIHLNNGAKWQTDDIFKNSISNIRNEMKNSLDDIHLNKMSTEEYIVLAEKVQKNLDTIISKCKLDPDVDEQAHIILVPMLEGVAMMEKSSNVKKEGAIKIIQSLSLYPEYFEHKDWKNINH